MCRRRAGKVQISSCPGAHQTPPSAPACTSRDQICECHEQLFFSDGPYLADVAAAAKVYRQYRGGGSATIRCLMPSAPRALDAHGGSFAASALGRDWHFSALARCPT